MTYDEAAAKAPTETTDANLRAPTSALYRVQSEYRDPSSDLFITLATAGADREGGVGALVGEQLDTRSVGWTRGENGKARSVVVKMNDEGSGSDDNPASEREEKPSSAFSEPDPSSQNPAPSDASSSHAQHAHPSTGVLPTPTAPPTSTTAQGGVTTSRRVTIPPYGAEILSSIVEQVASLNLGDKVRRKTFLSLSTVHSAISSFALSALYRDLELYETDNMRKLWESNILVRSGIAAPKYSPRRLYIFGTEKDEELEVVERREGWNEVFRGVLEDIGGGLEEVGFEKGVLPLFATKLLHGKFVFPNLKKLTLAVGTAQLPPALPAFPNLEVLELHIDTPKLDEPTLSVISSTILNGKRKIALTLDIRGLSPNLVALDAIAPLVHHLNLNFNSIRVYAYRLPILLLRSPKLTTLAVANLRTAEQLEELLQLTSFTVECLTLTIASDADILEDVLVALVHHIQNEAVQSLFVVEVFLEGEESVDRVRSRVRAVAVLEEAGKDFGVYVEIVNVGQ